MGTMRARRGLAVLLVTLAACGRCGRERPAPPERHLPADSAAVVLPRLDDAARSAAALLATAERFPALAGVAGRHAAAAAQLGFDPLDAKALLGAGLDPTGGAALARTPAGLLAVLPVDDAARFEETVARIARDRLGAGPGARVALPGAEVTIYRASGSPSALALAFAGRLAFLAPGPDGPALAARAAGLAEADALGASAPWKAARAALPRRAEAIWFAPPGAPSLAALPPLRDGAALALSANADSVDAVAAILLPPVRLAAWREVAAGASGAGGADDLSRLPADAVVAARLAGDPAPVARRLLGLLPEGERARLAPLADGLLPLLAPGAALSFSLAPTFDFTAFSRGRAAPEDPFRFVHAALVLRARSPQDARRALDAIATAAPALGLASRTEPDTLTLSRGAAVLRLAAVGDRVLAAGGDGRLEALRTLAARGGGLVPPVSADLAGGGVAGLALAPEALVRGARALPDAAFGSGPDAFVMRSIADRVLDPASRLRGAAARLELVDGAAVVTVRVEARPGAAVGP
jgi:hypothetical protein